MANPSSTTGTKPPNAQDVLPQGEKNGTDQAAAQPRSVLPKMKAASEQTYLRAVETGATMALPQQTQELVQKAAKLEEDIRNCEQIGGEDILAIAEKKKLEMKALQPKLPLTTQPLKDHENVVSTLS